MSACYSILYEVCESELKCDFFFSKENFSYTSLQSLQLWF